MERCAKDGAAQVALLLPQGALEAIGPAGEVAALRYHLQLVFVVRHNLGELRLHEFRVARLAPQTAEHVGSAVDLASLDEVTGRFGQKEETDGEDDGPEHLQPDRDPIRGGRGVVLGAIIDARGEEQADGDAKLISRHNGAADLLRGDLGHVQDDDGRDEADTETGDQTTTYQQFIRGRCRLQRDPDEEDDATDNDRCASTSKVGDVTRHQGTEECTGGQDGDDEGLLP